MPFDAARRSSRLLILMGVQRRGASDAPASRRRFGSSDVPLLECLVREALSHPRHGNVDVPILG
eukprot:6319901-Pyramimonas_sp.AAC.1